MMTGRGTSMRHGRRRGLGGSSCCLGDGMTGERAKEKEVD